MNGTGKGDGDARNGRNTERPKVRDNGGLEGGL